MSGLVIATVGLGWLCLRSSRINFLPPSAAAEWILFPNAVEIGAHAVASLDTSFNREFTLDAPPRSGQLRVRGARRVDVKINGTRVDLPVIANWKDVTEADVQSLLRPGLNLIEARVFHDTGPPALWLALTADEITVRSDESWRASFAGSAWRTAALASKPRIPGPGNAIAGGETTMTSLRAVWLIWLAFAGGAAGLLAGGHWWFRREKFVRFRMPAVLIALAVLWVLLFLNNARLMPMHAGFDSQAHLDYIQYLQEHRALPWPNDGVQMFQPPLFYLVSAGVLAILKIPAASGAGVLLVRSLTMVFGIAHFSVVFFSLRLLWPQHPGRQLIGLTLAAFLPMNLYLSHYCTNETLAALLVSLSIYLTLRMLRQNDASWWQLALLGLTSGAAALTKFTALLVLPFIVAALAARFFSRRTSAGEWRKLTVVPLLAVLVSGWHYFRIARHAGRLVIGGWDPASGFVWWQEDGYRAPGYFLRFGESLVRPYFSASASFADGIYSTLWGDGLCGGVSAMISRVPWNYDLMTSGYLLSVAPSALILIGVGVGTVQWMKRGGAERFVLAGFAFAILCGLIYVNLRVPAYASVKAFYGLSALTPLAFFGALGWDRCTRGRMAIQVASAAALLVWAMNSYASVWVRESADQLVYRGLRSLDDGGTSAASAFTEAIERDPSNATARRFLAPLLAASGNVDDAVLQAERATELAPLNSACHLQLASVLGTKGEIESALAEVRRALELGIEDANAHRLLSFFLLQRGANPEASTAAGDGIAVSPFNADLHYTLAVSFARSGEVVRATNQFAYALLLRPTWPEARENLHKALLVSLRDPQHLRELEETIPDSATLLGELAWLLATSSDASLRHGPAAVRVAERAARLTSAKNPELLDTLAAAYAETGRFGDAIRVAEEALALARATGGEEAAGVAGDLIASFRRGEPFRETPAR